MDRKARIRQRKTQDHNHPQQNQQSIHKPHEKTKQKNAKTQRLIPTHQKRGTSPDPTDSKKDKSLPEESTTTATNVDRLSFQMARPERQDKRI